MVVQSSPREDALEDAYDAWYRDKHIPELLAVPGFVSARRYRVHGDPADPSAHRYLAVYEIESDDLAGTIAEMRRRRAAAGGDPRGAEVLSTDPPSVVTIYELVD
jgi:hypothetical protein